ncbi:MAG TPA: hypothetical protein VN345_00170 [Blastocatellia bacterium]|jgi:hypothetical protein|nr:hypothetical protein [Blastocatellia bacterium]
MSKDEYAQKGEWAKKREWIVELLKRRSGHSTTQEIREGLSDLIKKAVAEKDIGTLALLAGWFVLVSEDITIDRFKMWMEEGGVHGEAEPPTKWWSR